MKYYAKPLGKLINELSKLPGVGGKTAQRLAFHILSLTDSEAESIAEAIVDAKRNMKYCSKNRFKMNKKSKNKKESKEKIHQTK